MRVAFDNLPKFSKYVLVDGAFDPLHAGHLAYLAAAFQHGPLLCAVASDQQIQEKGRAPLLPQESRADVLDHVNWVSAVHLKDRSTEQVIEQMHPKAYIKAADWTGRLPAEQVAACERLGIPIHFMPLASGYSSSGFLKTWLSAQSERGLDHMEAWIASHPRIESERYDREYFHGAGPRTAYTLPVRRIAEGARPDRIAELWPGASVLDVGCGPGCLMALLQERGLQVRGVEPSMAARAMADASVKDKIGYQWHPADVVISREVLEHLTIPEVAQMVAQFFTYAKKAVVITTRFNFDALSPFDVIDQPEVDPTHQTLLFQPFLRSLCVMAGGRRRRDWETRLDFQGFGCTLAYEVNK